MDIEWAKDGHSGELFIVQARPETVQSGRDKNILKEYSLENKSEDYEVPQEDRFEMGGDASGYYHEIEYGEGGVARAKDVIMNKIGWSEEVADYLVSRSEKFAIWLADSIIKNYVSL